MKVTTNKGAIGLVIASLALVMFLSFGIADHVVKTSTGQTNISILEDTSTFINLSVNNTGVDSATNITQVNITFLNSNFSFINNTNNSDIANSNFSNTSTVLYWSNNSNFLIANNSLKYFQFNLSVSQPGTYNITVSVTNVSGASTSTSTTNITFTVNDTTAPSNITYFAPTNVSYTNSSNNISFFNLTVVDNGVVDTILVRVYNASGLVSSNASARGSQSLNGNFSLPRDGTYFINATVNDTANNVNNTPTRVYVYDTTGPTAVLAKSSTSTKTELVIDLTVHDMTNVTTSCSAVGLTGLFWEGTGTSQTITQADLVCGTTYAYNISCTDGAGNVGYGSASLATNDCASTTSSGGSGGGSSSSSTWTNTYSVTDAELSSKGTVTKELAVKNRVQVKISGTTHSVGVLSISGTTVKIEVASDPQQADMTPGQTKKFDLDSDGYYDISVTVNSVTNGKASVSIVSIREAVPSAPNAVAPADTTESTTDAASDSAPEVTADATESKSNRMWIAILIVVIVVVLIVVALKMNRKK